jgi:hypothetical protein
MYSVTDIVLGLPAMERWSAMRRMETHSAPQQWFVLLGIATMLVLLVLLIAISYRRHQQAKEQKKPETFADNALRRGLVARERQILLAIAVRSGLRRTQDVFHEADAFARGAAQLLEEYAQTRTPQENDDLKAEVSRLQQKLGFQKSSAGRWGAVARRRPSSREIPVGKSIELTGRGEGEAVVIRAEVLRNDEIDLAVALPTPLESKAGDSWLARYYSGMAAWEFRTSTVSCDGKRLILSHSEQIHFVNRRRFPRVAVHAPALLAHFPLTQSDWGADEPASQGAEVHGAADIDPMAGYVPAFVESTVTEFAGPGLRIETPLQVQVDDRVVVVFRLAAGIDGAKTRQHVVAAVGRVRHGRDIERGVGIPDAIDRVYEGALKRDLRAVAAQPLSIAVELTGLGDEEIDELALITNELSSHSEDSRGNSATRPQEKPAFEMTAT